MGCHQAKPSSSKNIGNAHVSNRKSMSTIDGQRSYINIHKRNKKSDTITTVPDYTITLKQLEFIREGLQNMPIMPPTVVGIDPITEIKNKKIIQRHQSGQLISIKNSKLFQRRKTQLSSTSNTNSCNGSFCSKQQ